MYLFKTTRLVVVLISCAIDPYSNALGYSTFRCVLRFEGVTLESFKIIAKGKVFMVRAKELFTWNLIFLPSKEKVYSSDDESARGENSKEEQSHVSEEEEGEFNTSDVEGVAETIFGDNSASSEKHNEEVNEQHSEDPFELYELLKQKKTEEAIRNQSPSLSHPQCFVSKLSIKLLDHNNDEGKEEVVQLQKGNVRQLPLRVVKFYVKEKGIWRDSVLNQKGQGMLHDDLDAYASDCDDLSLAKVVLMANISSYDPQVLYKLNGFNRNFYDDSVIAKEHAVISMLDDEETLILEEESRSKMLDKQNDPISIEKKIKISPIDYSKLNKSTRRF
ncbi:hypothetical protein Tco_0803191 [Tanacetum coccineum]|uniref:Uncharacterized protein n=1 Tax=Tanacetum coccineum TaxID=301880 RepID=A0ABQ5A120_9ASTR